MKHGKAPTKAQKIFLRSYRLDPANWLIVKNTDKEMTMIAGITVNDIHSHRRHKLRLLKRTIGSPPKDDHTDRVPFSSVTYDFDEIFGGSSFGERTLTYQFEFLCFRKEEAVKKLIAVLDWLHWSGRKDLYDDMLPGYHFSVREPTVSHTEKHGVYLLTVVFKASPEILPNTKVEKEKDPPPRRSRLS